MKFPETAISALLLLTFRSFRLLTFSP